jgi:tetratricopeptide (TPR) repeat protein
MSELADPKSLFENADGVYNEGDFENAARLYGEAASAFQARGDVLTAAEMKNNQSVSLLQDKKLQQAFDVLAGTADVFAAAGDTRRQGIAFANEATALQALNSNDQAIEKYVQSGEAFKQAGEEQMYSSVMQAVAGIYLRRGKISEALNYLSASVSTLKNPTLKQKLIKFLLRFRLW